MNRRTALLGLGAAIGTVSAGCLDHVPLLEDEPRVDDPPAALETEPTLSFDRVSILPYGLPTHEMDPSDQSYVATLVTEAADLEEIVRVEDVDDDDRDRLEAIDFDETVLVAVASGPDSSSVSHRWARVEAVDGGLHLHGEYDIPSERTDDLSPVRSVLEVERPDGSLEMARVSLTVDDDRRVHFDSTEGVVTLEE